MVKCKNCGGNVHFDPVKQLIKCDYCDSEYSAEETKESLISKEDGSDLYESMAFTCPMCGAEILQDQDTAVTFCSYCGSGVELSGRLVKMKVPTCVVPFQITKEDAEKQYKKFIGKALYAPSYMKTASQTEKIRGIYMPYWVYEMHCHGDVAFDGEKSRRSGDYILTDHYKLNSRVDANYKGIAFDSSSAFADELSEAIAPFDIRASKPFYPGYISGFYADAADVDSEVYSDDAVRVAGADITCRAKTMKAMAEYNLSEKDPHAAEALKVTGREMAYFPVWFLAIRQKGYVSYAVVNGQSGKVAADVPIDFGKFLIGSVIIAIPIMIALDLFVSLRPPYLCAGTMLFALISMIISNMTMNRIYTRQNYYDDQGVLYSRGYDPNRIQAKVRSGGKLDMSDLRQRDAVNSDSVFKDDPANDPAPKVKSEPAKDKKAEKAPLVSTLMMVGCLMVYVGLSYFPVMIIPGIIMILFSVILGAAGKNKKATVETVAQPKPVLSQPFKEKIPVLIKPIIAILIGVVLFLVKPWRDIVYYIGIIVMMIPVLFSYIDVIRLHNQLSRRMPRQLNQRAEELD
ncbi:MAG: zinc ribbon domain-containing protein [Lachnospiraceae bacterium]|nr:zinc ribbon domain-containing protein [Lachnospiraceae bacterium]